MRILVDGDACPVKSEIIKIAEKYDIEVVLVNSICHSSFNSNYNNLQKIMVDNVSQATDMVIINKVTFGDIVITADYGLASLGLLKNAKVISFSGMIYDNNNIDRLLFERYLSAEARKSGKRQKGISKRSKDDDIKFISSLNNLILGLLKEN